MSFQIEKSYVALISYTIIHIPEVLHMSYTTSGNLQLTNKLYFVIALIVLLLKNGLPLYEILTNLAH